MEKIFKRLTVKGNYQRLGYPSHRTRRDMGPETGTTGSKGTWDQKVGLPTPTWTDTNLWKQRGW